MMSVVCVRSVKGGGGEMRDKYLTEKMGLCWHEFICQDYEDEQYVDPVTKYCKKCKRPDYDYNLELKLWSPINQNINFSSWQGFGQLWEWAVRQEWWVEFVNERGVLSGMGVDDAVYIDVCFINPDKFANALYEYLDKGR